MQSVVFLLFSAAMQLTEVLSPDLILPKLKGETKLDVITEFADAIALVHPELDKDAISNILLEREKLGSTGIQDGIAIPHGKVSVLKDIVVAFGRSAHGIDFQAHDNKLTHLFFVLLAPENATGHHLKLLARLSRLLKQVDLRNQLMESTDAEAIYQTLCNAESEL